MIEQSLVYIHSATPPHRFVGCGTLVEGGYIATCRHVWRIATATSSPVEQENSPAVQIEFPYTHENGATVRTLARLADGCEATEGQSPDLALLLPEHIPNSDVMALQLAAHERFEFGPGYAIAGLAGRDQSKPNLPEDVRIEGTIANFKNAKGTRQFTGINDSSYWSGRGSSGSPAFLQQGQQLAGILSRSEVGANQGDSPLREAFIVPGTIIRPFVGKLIAQRAAKSQHLDLSTLKPVLEALGAQEAPLAEIPDRLSKFVEVLSAMQPNRSALE